jgi:Fe-S oxidoreductase
MRCEVAMDHGVETLVLACPSCGAALVYYHGQTFAIDESELRYLRTQGHVREARGWIRAAPDAVTPPPSQASTPPPVRPDGIAPADIELLRRELDACDSVDDFLRMLG